MTQQRCEYCRVRRLAYDGARFCGAACSAAFEMKIPRPPAEEP